MKRVSKIGIAFAIAGLCALQAQTSTYIAESKRNFTALKNNLQKMAEAMPEESYSFKPTPEIRTFGELMAHIADTQALMCSNALGTPKSVDAAAKKSKADLVAAMKDSSAMCDAAFDSLTDANAAQSAMMGHTKLGLLQYNSQHSAEEYGYGSIYLRLKGIVPPSTAGRGR